MSTEAAPALDADPAPDAAPAADEAWDLSPMVSLRPEPFGALAYHFGNRRLSFLKRRDLVDVVRALGSSATVGDALAACGVEASRQPQYLLALGTLARADMIRRRPDRQEPR